MCMMRQANNNKCDLARLFTIEDRRSVGVMEEKYSVVVVVVVVILLLLMSLFTDLVDIRDCFGEKLSPYFAV